MTSHSQRTGSGCYAKPLLPNCGFFEPTEIAPSWGDKPRVCFFYEDCGSRVHFYYASHLAITRTFASEAEKAQFLAQLPKEGCASLQPTSP